MVEGKPPHPPTPLGSTGLRVPHRGFRFWAHAVTLAVGTERGDIRRAAIQAAFAGRGPFGLVDIWLRPMPLIDTICSNRRGATPGCLWNASPLEHPPHHGGIGQPAEQRGERQDVGSWNG